MTTPPTKEQIKEMADRAEARSRGKTAEDYVESTAKVERLKRSVWLSSEILVDC